MGRAISLREKTLSRLRPAEVDACPLLPQS